MSALANLDDRIRPVHRALAVVAAAGTLAAGHLWPGLAWLAVVSGVLLAAGLPREGGARLFLTLAAFHGGFVAMATGRPDAALVAGGLALVPAALLAMVRPPVRLLLLPGAWTLLEIVSRMLLRGYPWTPFGLPLADYPAFAGVASVGGPEAVTFLALSAGVALWGALSRAPWLILAQAALAMLLALGLAAVRIPPAEQGVLRLGIVQPKLSPEINWTEPAYRQGASERLHRLVAKLDQARPDLIAIPVEVAADRAGAVAPLLAVDNGTPVFWSSPRNDASRGREFELPSGLRFSALTGTEGDDPSLARAARAGGAAFLVSLAPAEAAKPLRAVRLSRLSAVSSGEATLRAANMGVSCSIDPWGRVTGSLPRGLPVAAVFGVVTTPVPTVYARFGEWPVLALLAAWCAAVLLIERRSPATK